MCVHVYLCVCLDREKEMCLKVANESRQRILYGYSLHYSFNFSVGLKFFNIEYGKSRNNTTIRFLVLLI